MGGRKSRLIDKLTDLLLFLKGSEKELQLVLLDTVLLCGNTGHDHSLTQPEGTCMVPSFFMHLVLLMLWRKSAGAHAVQKAGHTVE